MTTYSTEVLVTGENRRGEVVDLETGTFSIIAPDSSRFLTYDVLDVDERGLPEIDVDFDAYGIFLDGEEIDTDAETIVTSISVADWGDGSAVVLTLFSDDTREGIIIPLSGDALPEFANVAEYQAFFEDLALTAPVDGSGFGPGEEIDMRAIGQSDLWDLTENDRITGTDGNDEIAAGRGNDRVVAREGRDVVDGGAGNDRIWGNDGRDVLNGQAGNDTLRGGNGNDELNGGGGRDILDDGAGDDIANGGAGNDIFRLGGEGGEDQLNGGRGTDTLIADPEEEPEPGAFTLEVNFRTGVLRAVEFPDIGPDSFRNIENFTFLGGQIDVELLGDRRDNVLKTDRGADSVDGGAGNDTISTGDGRDVLLGGIGNDTLNGGGQADRLVGGKGRDTLRGGDGNDILIGGAGNDTLRGGDGADTFVFRDGTSGDDVILDFEAGIDSLDLDGIDDASAELTPAGDTLITYDNGQSTITVEGADLTDLFA